MKPKTALVCRSVQLRAGGRTLVESLDLSVSIEDRWVVLGPNGAGKSTLLAVLAGVHAPVAGAIECDGRPLSDYNVTALAERRALVTDRWHDPFSASVLDTVLTARFRFGAGRNGADPGGREIAHAALLALDCAALANRDVRRLSRGERQRVAISTALAQDTPLLLLDEPISHQDPRHQTLVLDALRSLPGRTVLASMHDVNAAARMATHALLLAGDGSWHAGPAADLLTASRLSQLFGTDFVALPAGDGKRVFVQEHGDASL